MHITYKVCRRLIGNPDDAEYGYKVFVYITEDLHTGLWDQFAYSTKAGANRRIEELKGIFNAITEPS